MYYVPYIYIFYESKEKSHIQKKEEVERKKKPRAIPYNDVNGRERIK